MTEYSENSYNSPYAPRYGVLTLWVVKLHPGEKNAVQGLLGGLMAKE